MCPEWQGSGDKRPSTSAPPPSASPLCLTPLPTPKEQTGWAPVIWEPEAFVSTPPTHGAQEPLPMFVFPLVDNNTRARKDAIIWIRLACAQTTAG